MVCELYGQVDIELSSTEEVEVVLEGQLDAVQLKGQIDIALESAKNIYLGSIMNDPNINASITTTLNLAACLKTDNTYINAIAKPCCDNLDAVIVQVLEVSQPTISTLQNNYSGQGFIYNGDCYQFTSIGGNGTPVTTVLPEDYLSENCTNSICPECPSPTPSLTPSTTTSVTQTPTPTTTPTNTQTPTNTTTPTNTQTPTNSITPTNTQTPTNTVTPTTSISYTNWGAKECCNEDLIIVQVLTNNQPTTLTDGFIYNGKCYKFSGPGGSNPITTILPEDYNNDPCNNPSCPSCPSPTPTPTQTSICSTCDEYLITNNSSTLTLSVTYTRCEDGASIGQSLLPKNSTTLCSCTTPVRISGSNDWSYTNNGDCFASPTPTPTVTPTPSPTQPRGPEGCYLHNVKTSVSESDVCDGTASSQNLYFPYANDIREGDTVYTNSSCSSTLQLGRFVEDKYNSEPSGYIFEVSVGGTLVAHLCS